jgi:hypothetical protein
MFLKSRRVGAGRDDSRIGNGHLGLPNCLVRPGETKGILEEQKWPKAKVLGGDDGGFWSIIWGRCNLKSRLVNTSSCPISHEKMVASTGG